MANTENKNNFHEATGAAAMLANYYNTLSDDERREYTMKVVAAHRQLMDFRNIINCMVSFEDEPRESAKRFIA